RQHLPQIWFSDLRKLVHSRWGQKALESENAVRDERLDLIAVTRHDAAPKAGIDPTLMPCCLYFGLQPVRCSRRRITVQRHVDHRRDATGCRRSRTKVEAFPFGSSGFIQMNVR